ncbi:dethiobiotin synthase [Amphiplicatus metriothermophilus]|uniref:ATP-dependent dethiobiotin synthetase BioD n=1 Tax=Amphiplicatus metriothermophilus TaxID=1519374 RepID=A0A239PV76_9PROT|nr:dethiobiotin synthase [Amphiplicatus metriothermophilus]MBB5519641.1 dethiobiotin synthetase [Amphiplicatus metriothermophilus]SNT74204.1 dethiobiotin synthase [Amphiplicatus metriothermophilus]
MSAGAMMLGAGTEIGKTHVACALLAEARRRGLSVRAVKPVMSGFSRAGLAASDAGHLAAACGETLDDTNLSRYCLAAFEPALAPNVAARAAGAPLDYDALVRFARAALAEGADFTLIEGAGGVLSPLTDERLNADLAADLPLPGILATASYLGAVSHTLSAIESCERRGIRIAALAVSQPSEDFGAPAALAEEFSRWTGVPAALFPFGDDGRAGAAALLRLVMAA